LPRKIPQFIQRKVRNRANFLCEYCHADERWQFVPFTIDHVVPLAEGGADEPDNLALACFNCNRYKSNKLSVDDISLFNPRAMSWNEHFTGRRICCESFPKPIPGKSRLKS